MIALLNNILNFNKEPSEPPRGNNLSRDDIIGRLFFLISNISEEQQFLLLKQLLRENAGNFLLKLIVDMSEDQRMLLLNQLENLHAKSERLDNRKYPRKDCLISAKLMSQDMASNCYILDLSLHGAFVEADSAFSVGTEVKLMFSAPNHPDRLKIKGQIIWTDDQGVGVEFMQMTQKQKEVIKAFCDNNEAVYEIVS